MKDASDRYTENLNEMWKTYEEKIEEKSKTSKWKLKDHESEITRKYQDNETVLKWEIDTLKIQYAETKSKLSSELNEITEEFKTLKFNFDYLQADYTNINQKMNKQKEMYKKRRQMEE